MEIQWRKGLLITVGSLLMLGTVFVYDAARFFDGKMHAVFCDVGQGDATYIRTPSGLDVLVDGGPDEKVLSCLSSHMPFWDRKIELVFVTHPDSDHLSGILSVLKKYKVGSLNTVSFSAKTKIFEEFERLVKEKKVKVQYLVASDTYKISDGVEIRVLWPNKNFEQDSVVLGTSNTKENDLSLVQEINYKGYKILLTGDIDADTLNDIVLRFDRLDVLKIPHHGSRSALNNKTFDLVKPAMAVISVGKNSYGHPAGEITSILKENGIKFFRTDLVGEVEIVK